jgi:hypothetical protein
MWLYHLLPLYWNPHFSFLWEAVNWTLNWENLLLRSLTWGYWKWMLNEGKSLNQVTLEGVPLYVNFVQYINSLQASARFDYNSPSRTWFLIITFKYDKHCMKYWYSEGIFFISSVGTGSQASSALSSCSSFLFMFYRNWLQIPICYSARTGGSDWSYQLHTFPHKAKNIARPPPPPPLLSLQMLKILKEIADEQLFNTYFIA